MSIQIGNIIFKECDNFLKLSAITFITRRFGISEGEKRKGSHKFSYVLLG